MRLLRRMTLPYALLAGLLILGVLVMLGLPTFESILVLMLIEAVLAMPTSLLQSWGESTAKTLRMRAANAQSHGETWIRTAPMRAVVVAHIALSLLLAAFFYWELQHMSQEFRGWMGPTLWFVILVGGSCWELYFLVKHMDRAFGEEKTGKGFLMGTASTSLCGTVLAWISLWLLPLGLAIIIVGSIMVTITAQYNAVAAKE